MAATRIKICGLTSYADAKAAAEAGADLLGFVFAASPRKVSSSDVRRWLRDLPPSLVTVGVFMDQPAATVFRTFEDSGVDRVQLHGHERAEELKPVWSRLIKRIRVTDQSTLDGLAEQIAPWIHCAESILLDPGAGQGVAFDWSLVGGLQARLPIFVAGGLTPENVAEAIRIARPYGVDVSSGVESAIGKKDYDRIRAFIDAVRAADGGVVGE